MSTSTLDTVCYVFGVIGALYVLKIVLTFVFGFHKYFLRRETNLYQRYGVEGGSKSSKSWVAVTGATGALGFSYCQEFAKRGFNILIIARNATKSANIKSKLLELYPDIECDIFQCDLSKLAEEDSINEVENSFENSILMDKDIAVLVNNAAIGLESPQFTDFSVTKNVSMMKVNMFPCIVLSQILLSYFKERNLKYHKKSCIINVATAAASMTLPGFSVYGASKAFMKYWSVAASKEFSKDNIDIIVTLPGQMASEMSGFAVNSLQGTISTDKYARGTMKHIGKNRVNSGWFGHGLFAYLMSQLPMEILLIVGQRVLFPFIKSLQTEKRSDNHQTTRDEHNTSSIRGEIYTTTKGFSLSRGINVQKKAVDVMKAETPLLFIWTNITILLCIGGSIGLIAGGGIIGETITPIVVLCNIPFEVFSFTIVSSKYGSSGIMRLARGLSWIPSWIFVIIDFLNQGYDDINDDTKSDIYLGYLITFCIFNGVLTIYDLVSFFGWLCSSREEIQNTGFFDVIDFNDENNNQQSSTSPVVDVMMSVQVSGDENPAGSSQEA